MLGNGYPGVLTYDVRWKTRMVPVNRRGVGVLPGWAPATTTAVERNFAWEALTVGRAEARQGRFSLFSDELGFRRPESLLALCIQHSHSGKGCPSSNIGMNQVVSSSPSQKPACSIRIEVNVAQYGFNCFIRAQPMFVIVTLPTKRGAVQRGFGLGLEACNCTGQRKLADQGE